MSLSETTRKMLALVEERSGIPVHVEPDPNLPGTLLAKVLMARGNLPLHQVFYRPDSTTPPDYVICQQAGFILRHFAVPPERRCDLAPTEVGFKQVGEWIRTNPVGRRLAAPAIPQLTGMLRDGLLGHLRSIPVSMRVDAWLGTEFPDLRAAQRQSVLRQVQDSAATLAPQHRAMAPEIIFEATQAISAAFTLFWSRRLNYPQLALPFKAAGFSESGQALLDIWEAMPEDPVNDRAILDRWAEKLGIANWYEWLPYSTPNRT